MRQLIAAAEAKRRSEWDQTASTMALFANANFSGRFCREDFHPMRERVIHEFMLDDPAAEYERLMRERNR